MTTERFAIGGDRELVVNLAAGLVVLSVHVGDRCLSGPLAVCEVDVVAFLAAVTKATGAELASDQERVRSVLRERPGLAGFDRLSRAIAGISMGRRLAAIKALRDAGEVEDRGEPGRPRLHHVAPKAVHSQRGAGAGDEVAGDGVEVCKAPHAASGAGVDS